MVMHHWVCLKVGYLLIFVKTISMLFLTTLSLKWHFGVDYFANPNPFLGSIPIDEAP